MFSIERYFKASSKIIEDLSTHKELVNDISKKSSTVIKIIEKY